MDHARALEASKQEIDRLRRDLRVADGRAMLEAKRIEALKVELARAAYEVRRLKLVNEELNNECNQYQTKLNEVWAELEDLRSRQ
jgi:chromosome segregation ATPase